jgi:inosine-uridine nucleoside N-ribohydrolase
MEVDKRPAWQFMAEMLDKSDDEVTLLSLGGFTNLARLLELCPSTHLDRIAEIVAMAGAVHVDGNVALLNNARPEWDQGPGYSSNLSAEWNVFVDPLAAKNIFDSGIPLTLVPLDACNHVVMSPDHIDTITATDPIATLAKNIFRKKPGAIRKGSPFRSSTPLPP